MTFEQLYRSRLDFVDDLYISAHCLIDKMALYGMDERDIQRIFRKGKLYRAKCCQPDRIGLSLYDGKRKVTRVIVVRLARNYAKVVTVWEQKGRI